MIKIMGGLMIIIASTFIGLLKANKYKLRVKHLKEIRNNFQLIETEIFYTATPISEVMLKITERAKSPLCEIYEDIKISISKREGVSLGVIWKNAFEKKRNDTYFTKEDLETIYFFGSVLGTSDRQGQVKNTKLIQSQLIKLEENAEEEWVKNEKLYKNLGILLGLALVIILI